MICFLSAGREARAAAAMQQESFHFRYLAACAALAAGEALGFACGAGAPFWPLAAGACALTALFGYGWRVRRWPYLAVLLLGLALALKAESTRRATLARAETGPGPLTAEFRVAGGVRAGGAWMFFNSALDGVAVRVVCARAAELPRVGETWRCAGWLKRAPPESRRRRDFWVCGKGTWARRVATVDPRSLAGRLARLRARLSAAAGAGRAADDEAVALNRAMLLGEREGIPAAARRLFTTAGTNHVFAISGLHVMVVARLLLVALAVTFFPVRWAGLALVPALALYTLLVGASPSALRAATMAGLCCLAPVFGRRPDALVAWALTFAAFHVCDPALLLDVGAQLSFTVMLGILLFLRAAASRRRAVLGVSAAAWAAGVPIVARTFAAVSPWALAANVVALPLATLAVVFTALGAAAGCVASGAAAYLNNAAALVTHALVAVSWVAARAPCARYALARWTAFDTCAWYLACALALWLVRSVARRRLQL